ncbi:MAG TPA: ribosome silencing factor [Alphaproteobacteria bacterium]|nr:ribosome silencing factor [Alphaproteobacteria bacterium]
MAKKAPPKTAAKKKKAPVKAKKPAAIAAAKPRKKSAPTRPVNTAAQEKLRDKVVAALENAKGENILCVDVRGQSSLADFLVIASGRSSRQVAGLAENVKKALYAAGVKQVRIEGAQQGDWVVVDGGDVVVHLFRPEVRHYYRLEEVWGLEPPLQETFKSL